MKSPYINLYLSCFIILFQHLPATCQNTILINEKVFGGSGIERNCMLIPISTGTYFVAGRSDSNISGNKNSNLCTPDTEDVWLLKLDASLDIVWDQSIGGNQSERILFTTVTNDTTHIIIAVESNSDSSCYKSESKRDPIGDYWIVIVDSMGGVMNDYTWGGMNGENFPRCYKLSDGNYIVTGLSSSGIGADKTASGFGGIDYWVVKFDGSGNKLWDQTYGGSGHEISTDDHCSSIIIESDSNQFLLLGTSNSGISGNITTNNIGGIPIADWIVWKIDSVGSVIWQTRFGGTGAEKLYDVVKTMDGGYLLTGSTTSPAGFNVTQPPLGNTDCWVVKVDSLFNIEWDHRYGGIGIDFCVCGKMTPDGGYFIGGNTQSPSGFDVSEPPFSPQDYWIFKIDSLGNKLWDKRYGGSGGNSLYNFAVLPDTSIILSGTSGYGSSPVKSFPGYGLSDLLVSPYEIHRLAHFNQ